MKKPFVAGNPLFFRRSFEEYFDFKLNLLSIKYSFEHPQMKKIEIKIIVNDLKYLVTINSKGYYSLSKKILLF
ncbi:MAG: hypothetical protein FGM41_00780 [Bacteroidetes bacterium]|nr:hypothetical protein [Bacteroidota bacterium]